MRTVRRQSQGAIAFALVLALAGCGRPASAPASTTVAVAAASDLRFVFAALSEAFARTHPGVAVVPTFGSSGTLCTQLAQGAPFDVFLSADAEYPERLVTAGVARAESVTDYARGRLVLWVRANSPLDLSARRLDDILRDPTLRHLALANPDHAPYGRAAVAALTTLGLIDALRPRFALGDHVAQAAQFVQSGAADAGIIARSLALAPEMAKDGRFVEIPANLHPPIRQTAVAMKSARDPAAAEAWIAFLRSSEARAILERAGFDASPE